jgi:hypothetical protein
VRGGFFAALAFLAAGSLQAQTVTGIGVSHYVPVWASDSKLGVSNIVQAGDLIMIDGWLEAESHSGSALVGKSVTSGGAAIEGTGTAGPGISGTSTESFGVTGTSSDSYGVEGSSTSNVGVYGSSVSYVGVFGKATKKGGVVGESVSGDGMGGIACASCSGAAAVVGEGGLAGSFGGNVIVTNNLAVSGLKQFHIDHPLDPANKYLNHFSMESNEVLNTYSGNVTTDASGTATVDLPDYFEALNKDYRYQLTVIGQFAQAIVSEEIHGNRFAIRTDKPVVKVSWQVTGVRSDAYVKAHSVPVEEAKPEQERGYFLNPDVFGQPEEKSINWLYHPDLMREARAIEERRQAESAAAAAQLQKPGLETSGRN